ncbi:BnaC05g08010D [Brassica napus]|uniref:BnaC05g08010D protein n=1 Tax=Brassica napus TaxID=3708 RepID=A0A078HMB1_BRANA|nr:BnaC05g08010D [Brassica napus]
MKERGQSDPQKLGDFKALTSWPSNPWQFQGTNTIIVAAFTMATALLLLSLCGGVSAATPVLTVHDYPSGMTKTEEGGFGWQVWHRNGTACPHGTVPVQRVEAEAELSQGKYGPLIPDAAERATKGHQASFFFHYLSLIFSILAVIWFRSPMILSALLLYCQSSRFLDMVSCPLIDDAWLQTINRRFDVTRCDRMSSSSLISILKGHPTNCQCFRNWSRHRRMPSQQIGHKKQNYFFRTICLGTTSLVNNLFFFFNIANCSKMFDLMICDSTGNICDNIKPLKHLKTLWIDGARVSDSSLLTLTSSCRALPELGVSRCVGVTDGGMGLARNCSNLKALNLACSHLCCCSVFNEYISKCSHLLRLKLGLCANISDKGIFHIGSKCSKLLELDLYRCAGFGDDGLAAISRGCKSLNRLSFYPTAMSFNLAAGEPFCFLELLRFKPLTFSQKLFSLIKSFRFCQKSIV